MSNGDDKNRSKNVVNFKRTTQKLNPITNLPDSQSGGGFDLPDGIETLSDYIKYGSTVGDRRYNVPTTFDGSFNSDKDVGWDIVDPQDIYKGKAQRQSGWSKFGAFWNRLIVGEIIGGTIEGIGATFELIFDAIDGEQQDFENDITRFGASIREWTHEVTPIYRKNPGKQWDPGDGGWWAENLVTVGSTLSLLIPAAGWVKGISLVGKTMKGVGTVAKGSRYAKLARAGKSIENAMTLNKTTKWVRNAVVGGTAMRYMENFREAAETGAASYDKNYEFFKNAEKLDAFMKSEEGQRFQQETGSTIGDPNLRDAASRWIGGQAASHSFKLNWWNLGFDILQYAVIVSPLRLTRNLKVNAKVRAAQNSILKQPKIPKTRMGRFANKAKPWAVGGAWAYSEGIEEQINYFSMLEGIRKGDIMAGNIGWENADFDSSDSWVSRANKYATHGAFWTSTLMGTIGGAIFIGAGSAINKRRRAEFMNQKIKEIGNRSEYIQQTLKKRQQAYDKGDMQGVEEQNYLLTLELGLNAALAGNVDLLLEMMNDPIFEQQLIDSGMKPDEVQKYKEQAVQRVLKTEKTFRKYYNRIHGKKFGAGAAAALTQLDMGIQMYTEQIENIDKIIAEAIQNDTFSNEKYNIGPNTKQRHEIMMKRKGLQMSLEKVGNMKAALETDLASKNTTKEEKKEIQNQLELVNEFEKKVGKDLQEIEKEEQELKKSSQESYEGKDYTEEENFLNEANTGDLNHLNYRKKQYQYLRDQSWQQLQKFLNEEESDYFSDQEQHGIKKNLKTKYGEEAKIDKDQARMEDAVLSDLYDLISTPNITEQEIKDFVAQYPEMEKVQTIGNDLLRAFKTATIKQNLQDEIDKLRKEMREELEEVDKDVQDQISKDFDKLRKEMFNPRISRAEERRRVEIEQEYLRIKARALKYMYGDLQSIDTVINELFDDFVSVVGVVWGNKVGSIYRDPDTKELIFLEGSTNKEYIVSEVTGEEQNTGKYRNSKGQYTNGPTLGSLDMVLLKENMVDIDIIEDGKTFNIQGEYFNNLFSDPTDAIEYDNQGNVASVTLTKWDGTKVTFTSPAITYELADVIETLEAVKRTQFQNLVENDFLVIRHNKKEYIVLYENGKLVAQKEDGTQLTGKLNDAVLRKANIELANTINNEIQIIKNKHNEAKSTNKAVISTVTEETLSAGEVGQSETSTETENGQTARVNATATTKDTTPESEKSHNSVEEESALGAAMSQGVEVNQDQVDEYEKTKVIPEKTESKSELSLKRKRIEKNRQKEINDYFTTEEEGVVTDPLWNSINEQMESDVWLSKNRKNELHRSQTMLKRLMEIGLTHQEIVDRMNTWMEKEGIIMRKKIKYNKTPIDEINEKYDNQIKELNKPKDTRTKEDKVKDEINKEKKEEQIALTETEENVESGSGKTQTEKEDKVVTSSSPTTSAISTLRRTYPWARNQEFISRKVDGVWLLMRDPNGNLIPQYSAPHGKTASNGYRIIDINKLTPFQLQEIEKGSENLILLYHFDPIVDKHGQVVVEGTRTIESNKLVPYLKDGKQQVMVIYDYAIKNSDFIRTDIANSHETGVGTEVLLRMEPQFFSYMSVNSDDVVITVRLASNPNIIISQIRASKFSAATAALRMKLKEALKNNRLEIKARIAGKENGFIINLKKNGKSVQQSLSVLEGSGFELVLGVGQDQEVLFHNSDIQVAPSSYIEQGTVYLAIPTASGQFMSVRAETSNLSEESASKIISILSDEKTTPTTKKELVNHIVKVYPNVKSNRVLAMDEFIIKFPIGNDRIIGIQYNMEGRMRKNNFLDAISGKQFFYKLYDQHGEVIPIESAPGTVSDQAMINTKNTLRDSTGLELKGEDILSILTNYLQTKKYNVQKHLINSNEKYFSPINDSAYKNYNDYLTQLNIVTTDLPGGKSQKFHSAGIYLEVADETVQSSNKNVPEFLKGDVTVIETPQIITEEEQDILDRYDQSDVLKVDETTGAVQTGGTTSIDSLLGIEETDEDTTKSSKKPDIKKIDPEKKDDDIDTEFKLRRYEELDGAYDLISETEKQWFLSRFGEEGLDVINRVKFMILKDGRQAYGYYHKGMITIAESAKEGTVYWEAMRRIMDMHLTQEEKNTLFLEAQQKWGINSEEEMETRIAKEFMEYKLYQDETGLTAMVKKFFRELLYYIKNMLGMNVSIERLFRDLNTRNYKQFSKEELKENSNTKQRGLRQKEGFTSGETREIISNINFQLKRALQNKYGENWMESLKDPKQLRGAYESLRQHYQKLGVKLQNNENERLKSIGHNYLQIAKERIWYDLKDELGNVISPGFLSLAVKSLDGTFGVKYKVKDSGEINFKERGVEVSDEQISTEEVTEDELLETNEEQGVSKERVHGVNFYQSPIKPTLSKDVKIELGFIRSEEKGSVLGEYSYLPFDDVYAYLSLSLANTPNGDVVSRLNELAKKRAHPMISKVLELYGAASASWQNKFVSHFNKQNIQFKTLIIEDGSVKVVYTNRNGINRQIINDWISNRISTPVFIQQDGKEDLIDLVAVEKIREKYDQLLPLTKKRYENAKDHKKDYLESMRDILSMVGINLESDVLNGLYKDETVQVSDLDKYMRGRNSFYYILQALERGQSPYLASNMESGGLNKIASLVADYKIDSYMSSFINGAKKPVYAINLNTFDSKKTLELRHEDTYQQAIMRYFNDLFYSPHETQRHLILNMLLNHEEVRNNFVLSTFDVIKEKGFGGRATGFDNMNDTLSALTRFSMFYNSGLRYAEINTGTKADKTQSKYITLPKIGPQNSNLGLWKSAKRDKAAWVNTAAELLKPLAFAELARIAKTTKQLLGPNPIGHNEQIKNYHYKDKAGDNLGNGLQFIALRILNDPRFGLMNTDGTLKQTFKDALTLDDIQVMQNTVTEALRKYVNEEIGRTLNAFTEAKVVALREATGAYENISLPVRALEGKSIKGDITEALVEFAVNDLVYKPYINTIFGPDLAFYVTDENNNPIIDAGKRAYQNITPGIDPVWNEEKQYGLPSQFSHAILEDIFKDSEEHIYKLLIDAKIDEKTAKRISQAYSNINKTDAQGFTTLEFHRKQMESDGTWTDAHTKAYNDYWSKGLMGDSQTRKLLLDPRKTYYFGERLVTDSQGNETIIWEQIKHSTIPLIQEFTELFKEDTTKETVDKVTLNNLRQRMEAVGKYKNLPKIDMVNFESGVKVGAHGIGNVQYLESLSTSFLQTKHLRTPQVITTKSKKPLDGTQMAKLVLSNINNDFTYNVFGTSQSGQQVKDLYNSIYAEKIQRSHDQLTNQIGWTEFQEVLENQANMSIEEFGKAQLKFLQKIKSVIENSLEERELSDNYYLAMVIEKLVDDMNQYGFQAPLSFPVFAKRFESIILSLFKNQVLKQRVHGMNAVQVAEFGYKLDKELQIKKHKNGGIYAEVALPYELGQKLGLKPGDVLDSNTKLDPSLLRLLGYRIPTQGKNSMLSLRITKILPENMGSTIILPGEITVIMGSDFDIDKMYIIFPEKSKDNTKIQAFNIQKYREKKSFEGVSDQALSNALFDIRESIITSKHHIEEALDPLDSQTYQNKLDQYEKLNLVPDISGMNVNSTAADMYLEKINKDAAMLIGLFSLHSTGHAMAQQMGVSLKAGYEINIHTNEGKSHTNLSKTRGFDGNFISSYISEDQNEALDNAKHQRIGRVGVSVFNHGVVALLKRAGFNTSITLDFINQPLIRKFLENRYTSELNKGDFKVAEETAKQVGQLELFQEIYQKNQITYTPSASSLKENLTSDLSNEEITKQQIQLLSDFMRYMKAGRDLAKFNKAVSPEVLKNFSRLSYLELYNKTVNFMENDKSSIKIDNSTERVDAYRKYGINAAEKLTNYFVPYNKEGFLELKNDIAQLTGQLDGMLSPELTDVINSLGLYWAFTQEGSPFQNLFYENRNIIKDRLFTKSNSLLTNLLVVRSKHKLQNDPFLGMLYNHPENVGADRFLQLIAFNNTTKLTPEQKSAITDRWEELLSDERADVRNLAQRLVVYSVITSGFMLGPNSFVDLVPVSYWKSSGLTNYFRNEARTMAYPNYFNGTAADQIIRNIFTDQGLLMTIDKKNVSSSPGVKKSLQLANNEYFVHKDSNPQLIIETTAGVKEFVKYFKVFDGKWRLYYHMRDSKTGAVYKEIAPLGERYKFVEMFASEPLEKSMHPQNTLKFVETPSDKESNKIFPDQARPDQSSIDDLMPRLDKNVKEGMLLDLDNRLESWLMKHFNVPVEKYINLKKKLGIDAVGAADMLNRVVMVDYSRDKYTLPEETAHFYIEMLEDKDVVKQLLKLAKQTTLFNEVKRDYKSIYDSDLEFAKETAGQILGQYIVNLYEGNETEFQKNYGTGIIGTLRKLWRKILELFSGNTAAKAQKELHQEITKMFGPAAQNIIDGINPGGLSIENIGIHKYYALQKSNLNLGNLPDMAKNLFKQGKEAVKKAPYLKEFTERDAMNVLIGESNNITAPTVTDNYYIQDGVRMNRVSQLMEIFQEPFEQQQIAEKVAQTNRREGNPFNTPDKVIELWDFLRDDLGTGIHTVMEGLIQGRSDIDIVNGLTINEKSKNSLRASIPGLRSWVNLRLQAGSQLYAEVKIGDKADLIAGTVDVIEVTKTGKKIIHDFKSKMVGKFMNIEKTLPGFKGPLASITNNALNKYRIQLSLYKHIIEEKGIKIDQINVVPLEAEVKMDEDGNIYFENVGLATSVTPVINKLSNITPVKSSIIKKMINYTNPNSAIQNRQLEKESDQLKKIFANAKAQIQRKINFYEKSGESVYSKKLQTLYTELEEIGEKEGLILYTKRAVRDINAAFKRLQELEAANAVTPKDLQQILNFVQGYNILDEITVMAPVLAEHGFKNTIEKYVQPAIGKKNQVYEMYKKLGIPILAETLGALSSNPNMSVEKVEAELKIAGRDISKLARWLDAMGDSKDTVLAMIDKLVTIQQGKTRIAEHDLAYGTETTGGLFDVLEELEKYQKNSGINVKNNRKLYDFMLETTEDGKLTGRVVGRYTPEFKQKQREFIQKQIDDGNQLTKSTWNEFYKENPVQHNPKFQALEAMHKDDPRRKFYTFFIENYKYAQGLLPSRYRKGLVLPSLRASGAERLHERGGNLLKRGLNIAKEQIGESLAKHEDNIQWGEFVDEKGDPMDYVPIHYSRQIGNEEGQLSPENLSYALASSLKMYFTMATNFQNMQEIIHELEIGKELLKSRRVSTLRSGVAVKDQIGELVTTAGIDSKAYQRVEDYFNMVVYGKRKKAEGVVTLGGKKVNIEQIADVVLQYGSLRVLAMNQHAALSNVGFGNLMNWVEAWAGQHFGVKNFIKAKTIYAGGIGVTGNGSIIQDVIARRPTSKIGMVNDYYNILQHFDEYGTKIKHKDLKMRGMHSGALYFMFTAGEHMIQTQLAIAMMLNTKFETSKGTVNLWESYKVEDGRLILDPEVAEQFSKKERTIFGEKIQAIYQRMHGIYNTKDRSALQQYALGRWAFQFRKWTRPGALRRFEGIEKLFYSKDSKFKTPDYNERIQSFVEGNYVTAAKFLNQFFKEAKQLRFFTMAEKYRELDKWQQQNLRRALAESSAFLFLYLLVGFIKPGDEDDREDMSALDWETLYVLKRIESELWFYVSPSQAFNILRTPAANMTSIEAFSDLIGQTVQDSWSIAWGGEVEKYKRKTGKYDKGDPKIFKYFRNVLPFKELWSDPKDKLKFFDLK